MPPRPSKHPNNSSNNHNNNNNYNRNPNGGVAQSEHYQQQYHHHQFNGPPQRQVHSFNDRDGFGSPTDDNGPGSSIPLSNRKRPLPFSSRADNTDNGGFAKLFVGCVPKTATEDDIRPLFEEHGNVVEVVFVTDKRTGQQHGYCFIKYASFEEADRAIRALDHQHTLPGELDPIRVRYADERERLRDFSSAAEIKLYVGELNKQATEKEIEEIFSPYGRVEDIYILRDDMKQSRGSGFIKFTQRDMAVAARNALNGTYVMKGCKLPLKVRFADPKKPRLGEFRSDTAFRGSGFGPRAQPSVAFRPESSHGDSNGGYIHSNSLWKTSPQRSDPSSKAHEFISHSVAKDGAGPVVTNMFSGTGNMQQAASRTPATVPTTIATSTASSIPSHTLETAKPTCEWSEHSCPDGFKYYYNCVTKESRWEEPEELNFFKQQKKTSLQNVEFQRKAQISGASTACVYQSHSIAADSTYKKLSDQQQLQPQQISTSVSA